MVRLCRRVLGFFIFSRGGLVCGLLRVRRFTSSSFGLSKGEGTLADDDGSRISDVGTVEIVLSEE